MAKSLAVALGVRMNNKRKMAGGGVVKPKTLGETIGYPKPKRWADGGLVPEEEGIVPEEEAKESADTATDTSTDTSTGGSSPGGASTGGVGSGIGGAGTGGAATGGASTGGAGTVTVSISGNSGAGSNSGAARGKKGNGKQSPITLNISNVGGTTDAGNVASGDGPGSAGNGGSGKGSGGGGGGAAPGEPEDISASGKDKKGIKMAHGGMVADKSAMSLAQLIRKRKQVTTDNSQVDLEANNQEILEPTLEELNELAADEPAQGGPESEREKKMARIEALRRRRLGRR